MVCVVATLVCLRGFAKASRDVCAQLQGIHMPRFLLHVVMRIKEYGCIAVGHILEMGDRLQLRGATP